MNLLAKEKKKRQCQKLEKVQTKQNVHVYLLIFRKKFVRVLDEIIKLVHPQFQAVVADVLQLVPQDILALITEAKRDSTLIPDCLKGKEWQEIMGELRHQRDHDVCWAIVVSELIRAMRIIDGRQTDKTIRYSPQDLIDFSDKDKRRTEQKSGHYCYTLNLIKGMEYVVENGIQREEDRPFKGCPENVAERKPSEFAYIEKFVRLRSLEDALLQLAHHPIGAALAMFQPEYREIGKKIYRGPANRFSRFVGLHAISLMAVYEDENGEKYILGRASHGDDFGDHGYIRISLEAMLLYIPTPGEAIDDKFSKYFSKPAPLLSRFSYPKLLSLKDEEAKRVKHAKQITNPPCLSG
uniref:Peptidase C1A papain C-terminal domain-containing protein n=1 Tax=Brassica campestris TaxID=3711 RepID=M4D470_BRACM